MLKVVQPKTVLHLHFVNRTKMAEWRRQFLFRSAVHMESKSICFSIFLKGILQVADFFFNLLDVMLFL
uniref:Uncharacterized protein n=1 Tax=Anguilla anguilla TaxID=7936 RepID=A0A0E9X6J7_ANGAN